MSVIATKQDAVFDFATFLSHLDPAVQAEAMNDCAKLYQLANRYCEENDMGLPNNAAGFGVDEGEEK